jgi:fluoride exporter
VNGLWQNLLAVAVGGAGGAVLRFGVNEWFRLRGWATPGIATLAVNTVGCLLAGLLLVWLEQRGPQSLFWRNLLMVGFLGGLTTFSAFGVELLQALRAGRSDIALLIAAGNVLLGLAAVVAGWWLGRMILLR